MHTVQMIELVEGIECVVLVVQRNPLKLMPIPCSFLQLRQLDFQLRYELIDFLEIENDRILEHICLFGKCYILECYDVFDSWI